MGLNIFNSEKKGPFTIKIGSLELSLLVDKQYQRDCSIIIGADQALLDQCIPGEKKR
jgi:hypothetical protein